MTDDKDREAAKLVHRDDVDMDLVEDIMEHFAETHPGFKVVFAGDTPEGELPEGLLESSSQLQEMFEQSLEDGLCIDCGAVMPNYDSIDSDENWKPAEGWRYFTDITTKEITSWQCPECDAKEQEN